MKSQKVTTIYTVSRIKCHITVSLLVAVFMHNCVARTRIRFHSLHTDDVRPSTTGHESQRLSSKRASIVFNLFCCCCYALAIGARVMIPRESHLIHTSTAHTGVAVFPMAHAFLWRLRKRRDRKRVKVSLIALEFRFKIIK